MALGEIAKQVAAQALKAPVKDVLDSLRPGDLFQTSESAKNVRAAGNAAENLASAILGQVQAMQKALKEDEELVVLLHNALETMRVIELYAPSGNLMVATGIDAQRNTTRVISPAETLQLICKVMKTAAGAKPVRVALIVPKA